MRRREIVTSWVLCRWPQISAAVRQHITVEDIEALLKLSVGDLEARFASNYARAHGNQRGRKKEGVGVFRKAMTALVGQGEPSHSVQFRKGRTDAWKR